MTHSSSRVDHWNADYLLMKVEQNDMYIWPRRGHSFSQVCYYRFKYHLDEEYYTYLFSSRIVTL